jgi:hypothetical protein
VSDKHNYEVGYETLLKDFDKYRNQAPKAVGLARDKNSILLQYQLTRDLGKYLKGKMS